MVIFGMAEGVWKRTALNLGFSFDGFRKALPCGIHKFEHPDFPHRRRAQIPVTQ